MEIPIAFFIYNRPEHSTNVILSIRRSRPKRLFIIADGPKEEKEKTICERTRKAVEQCIDWPCDVIKRYAEKNLGLRFNIESGLDEVFREEKQAIFLEDDCVPCDEFFLFCENLLQKYQKCNEVSGISGNCFLPSSMTIKTDYYYSKYLHIWGWASWRRVWQQYRRDQKKWPSKGYRSLFPESTSDEQRYWNLIYERFFCGKIKSWVYPFLADLWCRKMMACAPTTNLVWNIGFGKGATNTKDEDVATGAERKHKIKLPYHGPSEFKINHKLDLVDFKCHFLRMEGRLPFLKRIVRSIKKRIHLR